MTDRLKPCPFCGGKAKWEKVSDSMGDLLLVGYKLKCSQCYASPLPNNYTGNKQEAVKLWNTRKPMDRIAEKLEDRIDECGRLYDYFGNHNTYQVEGYRDGMYKAIEIVKEGGKDVTTRNDTGMD